MVSEGTGGVVNELLVQMQSFRRAAAIAEDAPTPCAASPTSFLPPDRHFKTRKPAFANILLIGATNRADTLDPALLRPGRFDRVLHFGLPARRERRDLIDFFLTRKAHDDTLDDHGPRRPRRLDHGLLPGHPRTALRRGPAVRAARRPSTG